MGIVLSVDDVPGQVSIDSRWRVLLNLILVPPIDPEVFWSDIQLQGSSLKVWTVS